MLCALPGLTTARCGVWCWRMRAVRQRGSTPSGSRAATTSAGHHLARSRAAMFLRARVRPLLASAQLEVLASSKYRSLSASAANPVYLTKCNCVCWLSRFNTMHSACA